MEKKNIFLFDISQVNPLLTASGSIVETYAKLFNEELHGCSSKEEYEYKKQVLMQMLRSGLDNEKEIIAQANITDKIASTILEVFSNLYKSYGTLPINTIIDAIIVQALRDKSITRCARRIKDIFNDTHKVFDKESIQKLAHIVNRLEYTDITPNDIDQQLSSTLKVMQAIDAESLDNFLTLMQDEIDAKSEHREYFLRVKYDLISHNQTLENNFINGKDGKHSETLANSLGIQGPFYDIEKAIVGYDFAGKQIDAMLGISDEVYSGTVKSIMAARQLFLRANLAILDSDAIQILHDGYHEMTESSEYTKKNPKDSISTSMISRAFVRVRRDKARLGNRN